MEVNRNQFLLGGLVLVFLGLQFRLTESIVLTPECTRFLAERVGHPIAAAGEPVRTLVEAEATIVPPKTVRPPEWVGWALLSIGAVLVLHSLSLRRPG